MHRNTEQEWQFAASGLDATRAWLAAQPANPSDRRLAAKPTLELSDTYYESSDWIIFRAGFALRMRRERAGTNGEQTEVTLKSLHRPHDGLARRTEFSEVVDATDMASKNGVRVVGLISDQKAGTTSTVVGDSKAPGSAGVK